MASKAIILHDIFVLTVNCISVHQMPQILLIFSDTSATESKQKQTLTMHAV